MKQQQGSEACDVARDLAKNTQYDIHPNATILPLMTQNKSESKGTIRKDADNFMSEEETLHRKLLT